MALGLLLTLAQLGLTVGVGAAVLDLTPGETYLSLNQWDSNWYAHIVEHGYRSTVPPTPQDGEQANVGFLPGYPWLTGAVGALTGLAARPALPVTAQLCTWGFWVYLMRSFQSWRAAPRLALAGIVTVFAYPTAFLLVCGYSEALFLLALLGFLYWSDRGSAWA